MTNQSSGSGRARRLGVFLLTALAVLALATVWRATRKMKAEAAGTAQFQSLKSGETAKLVLEITSVKGAQAFAGNLLEKNTETLYRRTAIPIEVTFDNQAVFAMGKAADLRTRAVVYVTGTVEEDRRVHARQLVILSEYVAVK